MKKMITTIKIISVNDNIKHMLKSINVMILKKIIIYSETIFLTVHSVQKMFFNSVFIRAQVL